MGGGIGEHLPLIMPTPDDDIVDHNHSTNRYLSVTQGETCFLQSLVYEAFMHCQHVSGHVQVPKSTRAPDARCPYHRARRGGVEPPASRSVVWRSIQLSYRRIEKHHGSGEGGIRTLVALFEH